MMSFNYGNTYAAAYPHTTAPPQAYNAAAYSQADDAFFEDLSRQLMTVRRRHSRSSASSQRTPGSAMRIVKPSSASNSPRSALQSRRRTVVGADTASYISSQHPVHLAPTLVDPQEYQFAQHQQYVQARNIDMAMARPPRPVSWHPGSTLAVPSQMPLALATQFAMQPYGAAPAAPSAGMSGDVEPFPSVQPFSLSPAAYSSNTSPSTTFSPYVAPFDAINAGYFYSPNPWALSPSINTNGALFDKPPSPADCPALIPVPAQPQQFYQQPHQEMAISTFPDVDASAPWNAFVAQTLSHDTAPQTPPDSYMTAQPAQAAREEEDDDDEILVGMGLYDPPEKEDTDLTLERYRSSVAQLLGAAYKLPEPTGKGLKLEDAWELPEDADGDEQVEDDDDDAEGEDL